MEQHRRKLLSTFDKNSRNHGDLFTVRWKKDIAVFMNSLKDCPRYTREQEYDLVEASQQGDKEARKRLMEGITLYVATIARRFFFSHARYCKRHQIGYFDLVQEGILGLDNAINKFDLSRGNRLSTYSTWWIYQRMQRCLRAKSGVLPLNLDSIGTDDDGDDISQSSNVRDRLPGPEKRAEINETRHRVRAGLRKLHRRDREILMMRAGGLNLEEISEFFDISRERIRQIEQRALCRLALYLGAITKEDIMRGDATKWSSLFKTLDHEALQDTPCESDKQQRLRRLEDR